MSLSERGAAERSTTASHVRPTTSLSPSAPMRARAQPSGARSRLARRTRTFAHAALPRSSRTRHRIFGSGCCCAPALLAAAHARLPGARRGAASRRRPGRSDLRFRASSTSRRQAHSRLASLYPTAPQRLRSRAWHTGDIRPVWTPRPSLLRHNSVINPIGAAPEPPTA